MTIPRKVDDIQYPPELCARCKAQKMLCGRSKCPILEKFYISMNLKYVKEVQGSSPPSVFIGSKNYPKVNVGPAAPLKNGDTSYMEDTSKLINLPLDDIISIRYSLYRGFRNLNVDSPRNPPSYLLDVYDLVLSSKPTFVEMEYYKITETLQIDAQSQPFGPGGIIKRFEHTHGTSNQKLEKVYYDSDLKAYDAVVLLNSNGVPFHEIQKVFSLGMLGNSKNRKLVPTRWSITAVDSILSEYYENRIKNYEDIDGYYFFENHNLGNNYFIFVFPWSYIYENIETWGIGSVWVGNRGMSIEEEFEDGKRKVRNPKMGGSFFATKLPILEYLDSIQKKAGILAIRYVTGDYYIPIGVWQVRENIKLALRNRKAISNIDDFFHIVREKTGVDFKYFSKIYKIVKTQKRLEV